MEAVAIDTVWVAVAGCLVLFMQAGFALVEAGWIGAWGEWWYSDHFAPDGSTGDRRDVRDLADRSAAGAIAASRFFCYVYVTKV